MALNGCISKYVLFTVKMIKSVNILTMCRAYYYFTYYCIKQV